MGGRLTIEFDSGFDVEEFADSYGYFLAVSYDPEDNCIPFTFLNYPEVINFALSKPGRDFWEVSIDKELQIEGCILIVDSEFGESEKSIKNMVMEKMKAFVAGLEDEDEDRDEDDDRDED